MKYYHNNRCRKSREGLELLGLKGLQPEIVHYMNQGISADELQDIIKKLGISPKELVREGEKIFKEELKGKKLNDKEWIEWMIKYPQLIERPILVHGKKAVIGRPSQNLLSIL
ncbi:MAG TPA: arsenate reductase (glutaredoxin) [Saprospiraceae bacterium]|nr:arsenate reductase (glutaredoxin) [Saprospiraceae bacterium]